MPADRGSVSRDGSSAARSATDRTTAERPSFVTIECSRRAEPANPSSLAYNQPALAPGLVGNASSHCVRLSLISGMAVSGTVLMLQTQRSSPPRQPTAATAFAHIGLLCCDRVELGQPEVEGIQSDAEPAAVHRVICAFCCTVVAQNVQNNVGNSRAVVLPGETNRLEPSRAYVAKQWAAAIASLS